MFKISEFSDGKTSPGPFKKRFQGKLLRDCFGMIYWFLWGRYTFDIREVRQYFNKEMESSIDTDFEISPPTRFDKQMQEIIDLVGDQDFELVLLECRKRLDEENRQKVSASEDNLNF